MKSIFKKIWPFKSRPKINVVRFTGAIATGGMKGNLSLESVRKALDRAFENAPKEVMFLINCPGGSPSQTALIYERIKQLSKKHNILTTTFVEDVAASGGYWLACASEKIYALETSIVGSIGVVAAGFGATELIKKIGIERRIYTSGTNKSQHDPFSPENEEDINHLKKLQKEIHKTFIDVIRKSRGKRLNGDDDLLFNGNFWTGLLAKEYGLIDDIKDMYSYIEEKFGKKAKINYIALSEPSFLKKLFFSKQDNLPQKIVTAIDEYLLWSRYR
jgi:signal peptide peptidase SppA